MFFWVWWRLMNVDEDGVKDGEEEEGRRWRKENKVFNLKIG